MSYQRSIVFADFSGGLDWSRPEIDLDPTHTALASNMRIANDGSLFSLTGGSYLLPAPVGEVAHDLAYYQSAAGTRYIVIAGANKWQRTTADAAIFSSATVVLSDVRTGMTANTNTTFVTHNDLLYGLDPLNNIATWDGTTLTAYAPGENSAPPKGIILGIWDSKMWVAVANASGALGMTIQWSEVFDPTNGFVNAPGMWPAANNVTLGGASSASEKLTGGIATPDGLMVTTDRGHYLIYDSDSGANTVVDTTGGCPQRRSIARDGDFIYGVNRVGIWRTTGRLPLEYISGKVAPFFANNAFIESAAVCGVVFDGSYWVTGTPATNINAEMIGAGGLFQHRYTLEVRLDSGSIMQHLSPMDGLAYLAIPARSTFGPSCICIGGQFEYATAGVYATIGQYVHSVLAQSSSMDVAPQMKPLYTLPPIVSPNQARVQRITMFGRNPYYVASGGSDGWNARVAGDLWRSIHYGDLSAPPSGATSQNVLMSTIRGAAAGSYEGDLSYARINGVRGRCLSVGMTTFHNVGQPDASGRYGPTISRIDVQVTDTSRAYP